MRKELLPFSPPAITDEEIEAVVRVLRSGWPTTGPETRAFEQEFAAKFHCEAALPVSSGTAALHLALLAVGVKPGDAVITTPLTFASTAHAIEYCGAIPVFVDIDPQTLNISAAAVEAALTKHKNVRAILPVHLHGNPAGIDGIYTLAKKYSVAVVEDAAHAVGAKLGDRFIGDSHGNEVPNAVCFSFYATKNLTTIEGGMLTGHPDVVARARKLSFLGIDRSAWQRAKESSTWRYDITAPGFKHNLSDLAAAIGRVQLQRFDAMQARRRELAGAYCRTLRDVPEIELPTESTGTTHAWHLYVIRLRTEQLAWPDAKAQDGFIAALRQQNISASVHFIPLHRMTYFREKYGLRDDQFPAASREGNHIVSLPLYPAMTAADVNDVAQAAKQVIAQNCR
jgi:dTDP-4-amino-4,6-dideoxygalactose transaminase